VDEHNAKSECRHLSDAERCLEGTWVLDEVRLAVAKGYKILEVLEVYEYEVTRYDPETGKGGLFVDYIEFFKLKAEASGYPDWVRTENDEVRFIEQFHQDEGIWLDRDSISYNAAKRGLAKLCLNSMWGKLTERSNSTQTKLISQPAELYRFLVTPGVEVQNMLLANDDVVWKSWQYLADEQVPSLPHTNEVISAHGTAGARIYLYGFLHKLQEKAIYTDTDSDFHTARAGEKRTLIETCDHLGQMQSELKKDEIIVEVVCSGPKNYAYKTYNSATGQSKTVCNVRGITHNYSTSQLILSKKVERDSYRAHKEQNQTQKD